MTYRINADSFGSDIPANWQTIADYLNSIIDERGIEEDHSAVNDLWEDFWNGNLSKTPENFQPSEEVKELADAIRASETWDGDQLAKLCEYAGLKAEWDAADGDTFEQIAYKAAEILGVEII